MAISRRTPESKMLAVQRCSAGRASFIVCNGCRMTLNQWFHEANISNSLRVFDSDLPIVFWIFTARTRARCTHSEMHISQLLQQAFRELSNQSFHMSQIYSLFAFHTRFLFFYFFLQFFLFFDTQSALMS
jgi:hypothetical protein